MPGPGPTVVAFLGELDKSKQAGLQVQFPEKQVTEPGVKLTLAESKEAPTLSVQASAVKPGTKYICLNLDLDAPFPSFAVMSPIAHWLQVDLTVGAAGAAGGFAPFESPTKAIFDWAAPGPPPMSGPHRYVFMVWEQPAGMDADKLRQLLGLAKEPGLTPRIRWNQAQFEQKLGLGAIVAGNYFTV